ncbi:MAG: pyrroline-5-carboxylate reductase [Chloroflexi bacterium]|nr:pyrroline-5-carboxylate reductase [Chloroflexota bacterium]
MRMAFIGGGNMGEAMIRGILDRGTAKAREIRVSDISEARRSHLAQKYGLAVTDSNRSATERAEVIILAIKPGSLPQVMEELKGSLKAGQTVISIAAGVTLARLSQGLGRKSVVRAMPNMPAQIGQGMTVWTATEEVNEEDRRRARLVLEALGRQAFVPDERFIDMATAVSGSGPAYVFLIIESFVDAAVRIGLPRDLAQELVLETVLGSAHLVQKSDRHPAELRNLVTSPGGTTAEGLHVLEEGSLRALLGRAIIAAYEKAKALRGE